jgi:hypothetical protein
VLVSELDGRLAVLNPHLHDGIPGVVVVDVDGGVCRPRHPANKVRWTKNSYPMATFRGTSSDFGRTVCQGTGTRRRGEATSVLSHPCCLAIGELCALEGGALDRL